MNTKRTMGWWLTVGLVLTVGQVAFAGAAGVRLQAAYRQLVEADTLVRGGQTNQVAGLYREAVITLEELQRQYPGWQHEVIAARLAHARNRLAELLRDDAGRVAGKQHEDDAAAQPVSERMIIDELVWREKLARLQTSILALRRENMELKSRLRAAQSMPSPPRTAELSPDVRARLGRLLVAESERLFDDQADDAAVQLLEAGRALWPSDQAIALALGLAYCHAARFDEGVRVLRSVSRAQPEHVTARLALGAAWMGVGNLGEARTEIEAALSAEPRNADAHYNMARLLLLIPDGDLAQARRHYMQSVSLGGVPDGEIEQIIQRKALEQIGRRR